MRRSFGRASGGTAAVEFALIMPVLCLLMMGAVALGIGIWTLNAMEAVSAETARCVAIDARPCTVAPAGCAATPEVCFAVALSQSRGLTDVESGNITVNADLQVDGIAYASVAIRYEFSLFGYALELTASNRVPREA